MTLRPFEEIVAEHGPLVLRVCRAMLAPTDAEDAWSETFLSALRAYPDLRPGSNVRGWLVTIAHRKALDQIRAAKRAPDPAGDQPVAGPGTSSHPDDPSRQLDTELAAAVASLAPKQRAAVVCRYLADLSYAEIGELLGSSEAAARRSAADGIARLRRIYHHELSSQGVSR